MTLAQKLTTRDNRPRIRQTPTVKVMLVPSVKRCYSGGDLRLFSLAGFGGFSRLSVLVGFIPVGAFALLAWTVARLVFRITRLPFVAASFADKKDAFSSLFRHARDYTLKRNILSKNILDKYIPVRYTALAVEVSHGRERTRWT
jgi:hypothetical protein